MPRPLEACLSVAALRHNLSVARRSAPSARVWAMVKANAYGHGLLLARRGLSDADGLALVEFEGAAALRDSAWERPILMIEGAFEACDVATAQSLELQLVVHEARQIDWLAQADPHAGRLPVHLKVNTGMNRLGFRPDEARAAYAALSRLPAVASVHVMTHFANADIPGGADEARAVFARECGSLAGVRSLANSAALLDLQGAGGGWVRPGIVLYGASPFADRSASLLGLQPVMALRSRLLAAQELDAGDAVGYGSTFVAERAMRIGVVACGYADGYPRHAPTGTPVVVGGRRTRLVGRVSMDLLTVDLSDVPEAQPGTPVELWGPGLPVDEVAAAAGTIGYELLCAVAPRVRRVETEGFLESGALV